MNQVTIVGNVTKDPVIRQTKAGTSVASFVVACNRTVEVNGEKKELADFVNVIAWGGIADGLNGQVVKGSRVVVIGRWTSRSWDDQQGQKHYMTEVNAEEVALPLFVKQQTGGDFGRFGRPAAFGGAF